MGAILAGIIQGLGQHAAEQNSIKNSAQDKANQEMAEAFDKMAQDQGRSPEDQYRLHQMAYTARTKGAKAIPAAQLQYWQQQIAQGTQQQKQAQAQRQQQQNQQNQQAQQQVAQGTGLNPPAPQNPDNVQGPAGGMSQEPQVPTGLRGLAPPNPTSAAAQPVPAASPSTPAPQSQAGAPPPISGLPSPGFNTVAPTNTPTDNGAWVTPPRRNRFQPPIVDTGGAPLNLRSPDEQQEFAARGAGLKAGAEASSRLPATIEELKARNAAEFEKMRGISAFNRQENEALMKRMKQEGGSGHVYSEIGANGSPSLKIDPGVLSSRPVAGKDLLESNPGMADKFGRPIDPLKFYDMRSFTRAGGEEVVPTSVPPIVRVETPDAAHPEARFIVARDRLGQEIYREPYAPNAAFAPLVRTSTREQIVDMGDRKISVPVTSSTSSQRMIPGQPTVAPSLPEPNPAGTVTRAPVSAPPSGLPSAPVVNAPRGSRVIGVKALGPSQILPMKNSIEVASHQLWGDPDNPTFRPLSSYANLADDPGAKQRIGQALRMVLDAGGDSGAEHLGASAGPVSFSAGNLGTTLSYKLGIPQAAADEKAKALRAVFEQMKPEEVDYFNALMNAIPTVTGFRKLTSGGAFRWSQQGLERELPMIGLSGVTNSATFKKKMQALGDEPLTAIKNLERTNPGVVDPRLAALIRGGSTLTPPGVTPPAAAPPKNAEEYLRSLGR
jgi:hypothetical protein